VPSEPAAKRLQPEALDAFLDGILAELEEPADPVALNEIRAAFRKRVPFSKRSYAAAALILRAAGLSRGLPRDAASRSAESRGAAQRPSAKGDTSKRPSERPPKRAAQEGRAKGELARQGSEAPRQGDGASASRPRFEGEGTTLFFSMGKRQRLYPRILIDLLMEVSRLAPESIGEVRAFDNYSFADIDPAKAQEVISAFDGYEFKGRKLSVGPAKRRDDQPGKDED
jgi:hypothetical protein